MSDTQMLTIALASVPTVIAVLIGILVNNARMTDLRTDVMARFDDLRSHMDSRFANVDHRFDEMRSTWQSELRRVEEVLDARLKPLEER